LENPLSEEARLLRPSLAPGMIAMLAHNLNRDVREVRLFEQGTVFTGSASCHRVAQAVAGLTGEPAATRLHNAREPALRVEGRYRVAAARFAASADSLSASAAEALTFSPDAPAWIEPGRGGTALLRASDRVLRRTAVTEREARKWRQPVFLAELDLELCMRYRCGGHGARTFALPAVSGTSPSPLPMRSNGRRSRCGRVTGDFRADATDAVEIFRAEVHRRAAGHYALLLRCVFQSNQRTLREDELAQWSSQLIAGWRAGAVLRLAGRQTRVRSACRRSSSTSSSIPASVPRGSANCLSGHAAGSAS